MLNVIEYISILVSLGFYFWTMRTIWKQSSLNIPVPHILIVDLCVDYTFPETDWSARPFFTWRWYRINDWKLQCISLSRSCTLSPHRTNYTMSIFTFLCFSLSEGREEKKTLFEFEMKWNWGIILQRRY